MKSTKLQSHKKKTKTNKQKTKTYSIHRENGYKKPNTIQEKSLKFNMQIDNGYVFVLMKKERDVQEEQGL